MFSNENMEELAIRYFEYFKQKVDKNRFSISQNERKGLTNFFANLDKKNITINEEWLFDYLSFQFKYYHLMNTRFGQGATKVGWVFGKKAMDRFETKESNYLFFLRQFQKQFRLNLKDLFIPKKKENLTHSTDDIERERNHNTEIGFLNCIDYTNGYVEKNVLCLSCKFKKKCENIKI